MASNTIKERIFVPAQGGKTFHIHEELRETHFYWEDIYYGFFYFINDNEKDNLDDIEHYLSSHGLEYHFIKNEDDDILIQAEKNASNKKITSVKRKISKQKKELKYLEEELKDLIETSKELPKRNKI